MRIGINTRSVLGTKMEGFGNYTLELIQRLSIAHPEHKFVFYFDRTPPTGFDFPANVICKSVFPPTRHPLLYIWWFQFSLKKQIKKDNLDLFWSPDGLLPLGLKIPTIATIHDLNFEHFPQDLPWAVSKYYRFFFPRFSKQATKIITVSATTKNDIIASYGIAENKIKVIYNGVNKRYTPLSVQEKAIFIDKKNLPQNYFLFVGSLHPRKNIQRLLAAFHVFSEQNHDTHLVIVGSAMWDQQKFEIDAEIRKRIHFLGHVESNRLAQTMACACAFVYIPYFEGFGMPLAEAMATQTPIVAGNRSCLPEIAADAALYVDPFDIKDIAAGLLQLKNDLALQNQLKVKGSERVKAFNWDLAANEIWQEMQKLVS
ncbi:MAG: hypothetical protein RLZZ65_54 [Bacteroidota bacterium]|jgi:glycosyltransferase involved in cell wall biosynthesis